MCSRNQFVSTQKHSAARRSGWRSRFVSGIFSATLLTFLLAGPVVAQTSFSSIYDFTGKNGDSASPIGDFAADSSGALYGATVPTGRSAQVFQLTPPSFSGGPWAKSVLVSGGPNFNPVIPGKNGVLYGAAGSGAGEAGEVFQLTPPATAGGAWAFTILHTFAGSAQGDGKRVALGRLVMDSKGNLYGVTQSGGVSDALVSGTIYKLSPPATAGGAWTELVLYKFQNVRNGFYYPEVGLAIDKNGALYGSTRFARDSKGNRTAGVVFQLSPSGGAWNMRAISGPAANSTILRASQITVAPSGALFGVSNSQGAFKLTPPATSTGAWTLTSLYRTGSGGPGYELARDSHGTLFGTDAVAQTVYKLTPPATSGGPWKYSLLHTLLQKTLPLPGGFLISGQ